VHEREILLGVPVTDLVLVSVVLLQGAPGVPVVAFNVGHVTFKKLGGLWDITLPYLIRRPDVELLGQLIAEHGLHEATGHRSKLVRSR
jgi:hypothetical protein